MKRMLISTLILLVITSCVHKSNKFKDIASVVYVKDSFVKNDDPRNRAILRITGVDFDDDGEADATDSYYVTGMSETIKSMVADEFKILQLRDSSHFSKIYVTVEPTKNTDVVRITGIYYVQRNY